MIYGNASWGLREEPLENQLKITADMGLSLLELGIANAPKDLPLGADDAELERVKDLYRKYGVSLDCAATGNDFTASCDDVEKIKKVIGMCRKLGVKILRIFAGFTPYAEVVGDKWDSMVSCLNEVYDYAKGTGVTLTVETHGAVNEYADGVEHVNSVTTVADTLKKLIEQVPDIRFNYDPANLYAVGIKNPNETLSIIADRVKCVHMKDFVTLKPRRLKPAACGESDMDWTEILKGLSSFDCPALFEYEVPGDVADGLKRCYEYILNMEEN